MKKNIKIYVSDGQCIAWFAMGRPKKNKTFSML